MKTKRIILAICICAAVLVSGFVSYALGKSEKTALQEAAGATGNQLESVEDVPVLHDIQYKTADSDSDLSQKDGDTNIEEETPESFSEFEYIPDDVYNFAVTYMKAREISCVEARQYVRYFGEYGDFMMEAWGNNLTWLEEWNIDRFECVSDNLYVFFVYWKTGFDPDEDYTGPRRQESGYIPYFVCLMDEEVFIVHGLQFLPQGYGDGLDPDNYQAVHYDIDPSDIVDVTDIISFQELHGTKER